MRKEALLALGFVALIVSVACVAVVSYEIATSRATWFSTLLKTSVLNLIRELAKVGPEKLVFNKSLESFDSVEAKVLGGVLRVKPSASPRVEAFSRVESPPIEVTANGGNVMVKASSCVLLLSTPRSLRKAELSVSAGVLDIEGISVGRLSVVVDSGVAKIDEVEVKGSASISVSKGKLEASIAMARGSSVRIAIDMSNAKVKLLLPPDACPRIHRSSTWCSIEVSNRLGKCLARNYVDVYLECSMGSVAVVIERR